MSTVLHPDGLNRCPWPKRDPLYVAYHDDEWGVPERDDRALFEKLLLDGFQAGLSWITILRKRDNFRRAFDGFEPAAIARYDKRKVTALMNDAGIVRNRAKIKGAIVSARGYLDIMEKGRGFSVLLWGFVDGEPQVNCLRLHAGGRNGERPSGDLSLASGPQVREERVDRRSPMIARLLARIGLSLIALALASGAAFAKITIA